MSRLRPAMLSNGHNPTGSAGFSLIEILVALALLGLAIGAIASVLGNGARGYATADNVQTALSLAEEKLESAGVTSPLRVGRTEGTFDERFAWLVAVADYQDKDKASVSMATDAQSFPFRLFRIDVSVGWRDGVRERQIALSTVRLAPVPP